MSTRWKVKPFQTIGGLGTGLEGVDIPDDFDLPSCGIEDVDRAMFKLFNEDLPFYFEQDGDMKRIPCVFAGGERAMILRKKQPIRDRQGALVLPLISMLRTGIDQSTDKGIGPGEGVLTIKKRLAPEDRVWKRLENPQGLQNQDNVPTPNSRGKLTLANGGANVFEVITMPNPRFFKATYEITFWAQYLQQMNNIVEAFMFSYNNGTAKSFKIETNKGYWFVAFAETPISDNTNFDGYADDERIIKASITMSVTGYVINPKIPGLPKPFRRFVSAPRVQFDMTNLETPRANSSRHPSYDPEDYVYEDFATTDTPLPGVTIGRVTAQPDDVSINIGSQILDKFNMNASRLQEASKTVTFEDPFDGDGKSVKARVKSKNLAKGETVYTYLDTLNKE